MPLSSTCHLSDMSAWVPARSSWWQGHLWSLGPNLRLHQLHLQTTSWTCVGAPNKKFIFYYHLNTDERLLKRKHKEESDNFYQHRFVFPYEVSLNVLADFSDLVLVQIAVVVWFCDGRVDLVLPVKWQLTNPPPQLTNKHLGMLTNTGTQVKHFVFECVLTGGPRLPFTPLAPLSPWKPFIPCQRQTYVRVNWRE